MDNGSGHAWNLDQSRAEVVKSIAESVVDSATALYPWWKTLGHTLVEASLLTCAISFLTLLTAGLTYLVVSRRLKDSYLTLAIWVIPEWLTATTTWMKAVSRVAQDYAVLGCYIPGVRAGMTTVASCLAGTDCVQGNIDWMVRPMYTAHGCVGTTLLAANVLIQEGVLCALVLFIVLPEFSSGKVLKGIVVAPFLAACVSAAANMKKVCLPSDIVLDSSGVIRIQRMWQIFDPRGVDRTTASLTKLSHMVALFVLMLWIWRHRQGFVAQLRGSTEDGFGWIKPILIMYATSPVVLATLRFVQRTYYNGGSPRDGSMWAYAFFSAAYSIVPPLMGMWPGLVMIYHRLKMPDSILPVTQAKDDVAAPATHSAGMTNVKVDLTESGDPLITGGSQLGEKCSGPL
ncbi:hypothetical protein L226DRAFT_365687 [Lentinus tigrinus ALCF2SS1-7]|uniref:Uncharacterized protein n=1 Tax=Lentinus tigrinus ALCF2SS1-6 TaxID=1328759 RepID=A0A5C2RR65_9APHY|nr:hypothetical protein L227DRAFT_617391 [Lentinus tigrinus ALCF2SS1-6]RPD68194.1 hypothetical protein L226DRAFT_365687 [Lentinus tigrinus ALCF2SS1-7]